MESSFKKFRDKVIDREKAETALKVFVGTLSAVSLLLSLMALIALLA